MRETFEQWEVRLDAWLASLPPDDPVHALDEIAQCEAFSVRARPIEKESE